MKTCIICDKNFEGHNSSKLCSDICRKKRKRHHHFLENKEKFKNSLKRTKYQNDEFVKNIISEIIEGIEYIEISKKHSVSIGYVIGISKKNSLYRQKDTMELSNKYNILSVKKVNRTKGRMDIVYMTPCSECGVINELGGSKLRQLERRKVKYICSVCDTSYEVRTKRSSSYKKTKANTTGYIGVCIKNHKGEPRGYYSNLVYKGIKLLRTMYKDPDLHEKTLIQGAVDRDIFIIEKKLPHTRNFTDIELLGEMEYLAHEQLSHIKERLSIGKIKI